AGALGLKARIDLDPALVHGGLDVVVQHELQRALRALDLDGLAFDVGGDAGRHQNWFLTDTGHGVFPDFAFPEQNTVQSSSPPTFASRASWSAITPLGVEMIDKPRPLLTRG